MDEYYQKLGCTLRRLGWLCGQTHLRHYVDLAIVPAGFKVELLTQGPNWNPVDLAAHNIDHLALSA